jgi:4-amino-4-deoxy-L-arabinose transferase-like glycosyltransferase
MAPSFERPHLLAGLIIIVVTLGRLWVAAEAGLGDAEAYYWTWSRHLAPGYLDHGPVVAFLIRAGTALVGSTPLGVRLAFVLLSGLILWLVAALARRVAPETSAAPLLAAIGLLSIPAFLVAGAAANPDVPLMALVLAFLLIAGRPATPAIALLLGLVAGLAASTKLFGLALAFPLVVVTRSSRRSLAAGLVGLCAGLLPVVVWNAQHGWASLGYHLAGRHTSPVGPSLENLGKLVGGQLAYISPTMLLGLGAAAVWLWRRRREPEAALLLWTAAALVAPAYVLILLVPGAEPHWPAAGYLVLLPVLAARLPRWWIRRWIRILTWIHLALAVLVGLALHLHVLTDLGVRLLPNAWYRPRYDLGNELRGWDRVADAVNRQLRETGAALAAGCHYTSCAQLAFAARGRFEVRCPSPRLDQFDFSPGGDGSSRRGVDLIYVRDERFPFDARELYRCRRIRALDTVKVSRAGRVVRRFELQLCEGFSGLATRRWPPRSP